MDGQNSVSKCLISLCCVAKNKLAPQLRWQECSIFYGSYFVLMSVHLCIYCTRKITSLTSSSIIPVYQSISDEIHSESKYVSGTYWDNLDLIGRLRWAEMSAIMFHGFVTSVETIATAVAMPVCSTYLLRAFYWTDDITPITAPHYTQAYVQQTHWSKVK